METQNDNRSSRKKAPLLILSAALLTVGNCGGPLIMRLYFLHGGNRLWLSSWLETGGWPVILLPLLFSYLHRRCRHGPTTKPYFIDISTFRSATVIGVLTGFDDYFYAYGVSRLPVSTLSLIIASHLAFTAVFAYLLVKHKFTSYSVNAVVLLTVGAVVLALHSSGDRPEGESRKEYYLGFVMTVAAAMLYGLVLPMVELTYKRAKQAVTYTLVLEIQLVMCFFATVVCTVGMAANNDFKEINLEEPATIPGSATVGPIGTLAVAAGRTWVRRRSRGRRVSVTFPPESGAAAKVVGGRHYFRREDPKRPPVVLRKPLIGWPAIRRREGTTVRQAWPLVKAALPWPLWFPAAAQHSMVTATDSAAAAVLALLAAAAAALAAASRRATQAPMVLRLLPEKPPFFFDALLMLGDLYILL